MLGKMLGKLVLKYSVMTSCLPTALLRKFFNLPSFFWKTWWKGVESWKYFCNILYMSWEIAVWIWIKYRTKTGTPPSGNNSKFKLSLLFKFHTRNLACRKLKEKKFPQKFPTAQNPGKQICYIRKCDVIIFWTA